MTLGFQIWFWFFKLTYGSLHSWPYPWPSSNVNNSKGNWEVCIFTMLLKWPSSQSLVLIVLVKITQHYNHKIFNTVYMEDSTQTLVDVKWSKINETHREQWKPKLIRYLNFITPNFIPEENKQEMDMQRAYIWTSRTPNAQFLYTPFGFNVCGHSSQSTPYYLNLCFAVGVFL